MIGMLLAFIAVAAANSLVMATGERSMYTNRGDNQFWIGDDRLCVYMADSDELFEFDLDGKLQRRTSLHEPLARLARDHHGARAEIVTLAGNPRAVSEIAEVRIWTQGDEDVSPALVRLFLDGRRPQTLEAADGTALATASFPLLGTIGDEVLFLNRYTATLLRR